METSSVSSILKEALDSALLELEKQLTADVLVFTGPIHEGPENQFLSIVEQLAVEKKHETLIVVLTTNGGSATVVERYVNIIRHNYKRVIFIVPDYAYSAGTIFCMSGDEIWMDYFSVLGPIDPQVPNKDGKYVPALGYLDKIAELISKAQANTLTQAEFLILKDFDLAELKGYEQARELTITLLKEWLVKYKFKSWTKHKDLSDVTDAEKTEKAEHIAKELGDYTKWKTHGRPINLQVLESLGLKINDYSNNSPQREIIRKYYKLMMEYVSINKFPLFVHTRHFL